MAVSARAAVLGLVMWGAAPSAWAGDDLAAVVKKTLEVYGGEQALSKVVAVRETGKVSSAMRKGGTGMMVRTFSGPQKLRVEIEYPGEPVEVRVVDGEQGWRGGNAVQGPPLFAMVLQAARLSLPQLLVQHRKSLRDGGVVEREGMKLRAIEVPLGGSMVVTALVQPETGYIVQSSGRADGGPMPIEFGSSFSDFRKVQGLLVPFTERTVAMGQFTGVTTLEKIELLDAAPAGAFSP